MPAIAKKKPKAKAPKAKKSRTKVIIAPDKKDALPACEMCGQEARILSSLSFNGGEESKRVCTECMDKHSAKIMKDAVEAAPERPNSAEPVAEDARDGVKVREVKLPRGVVCRVEVSTMIGACCDQSKEPKPEFDSVIIARETNGRALLIGSDGHICAIVSADVTDDPDYGNKPYRIPAKLCKPDGDGPRPLECGGGTTTTLFGAQVIWNDPVSCRYEALPIDLPLPPIGDVFPDIRGGGYILCRLNYEALVKLAKAVALGGEGAVLAIPKESFSGKPSVVIGNAGVGVAMPRLNDENENAVYSRYQQLRERIRVALPAKPKED